MSFTTKKVDKVHIDLDGPQGNIYNLLGLTLGILRRSGLEQKELDEFRDKIYSQSYNESLQLIEIFIGSVVEFSSQNPDIIKLFKHEKA